MASVLPGQVDPKSPGLLGEGLAAGQELSLHGTESRERLECPLGTFLDTALCSGVALLSPPVTQPGILAKDPAWWQFPPGAGFSGAVTAMWEQTSPFSLSCLQEPAGNA